MRRALLVALALLVAPAHAAFVTLTWLPADGAIGYRIERATKPAGPWRLARDVEHVNRGRPSNLQVAAIDGLPSRGPVCVRVSSVWPAAQVSIPTEPVCVQLPRADVAFGRLTPGAAPLPPVPAPALSWAYCAGEGESCAFTGTRRVRYGRADTWRVLTLTNGASCANSLFGDPAPGYFKTCEVEQ